MLKENPEIIARSCFIDPVTFCSWEGGMFNNLSFLCETDFLRRYLLQFLLPSLQDGMFHTICAPDNSII